jgi:hypothetical protein
MGRIIPHDCHIVRLGVTGRVGRTANDSQRVMHGRLMLVNEPLTGVLMRQEVAGPTIPVILFGTRIVW